MRLFNETFFTGQVAEATNLSNATIQTWCSRGLIVGSEGARISGGGSPGKHRRFTFRNVIEIAVAKGVIDIGLKDLEMAFTAARHYAHVGYVQQTLHDRPNRLPGLPFDTRGTPDRTILAISGDRFRELYWRPQAKADPIRRFNLELHDFEPGKPVALTLLDATSIFE